MSHTRKKKNDKLNFINIKKFLTSKTSLINQKTSHRLVEYIHTDRTKSLNLEYIQNFLNLIIKGLTTQGNRYKIWPMEYEMMLSITRHW